MSKRFSPQLFLRNVFYNPQSRHFFLINNVLAGITLISVASIILESVPSLSSYALLFTYIEYGVVTIFALEYLLRIYANGKNAWNYIFSFIGIIDLLAVIPTFVTLGNATFLKTARSIRILLFLRVIRVAKLSRIPMAELEDIEHNTHLQRLNVHIYFVALLTVIILFGTLLYSVEGAINPSYESIPQGMIEAAKIAMGGVAQNLPTTAYGDVVVILTRFAGLTLFGLLIHIVGNGVRRALFGPEALKNKRRKN